MEVSSGMTHSTQPVTTIRVPGRRPDARVAAACSGGRF